MRVVRCVGRLPPTRSPMVGVSVAAPPVSDPRDGVQTPPGAKATRAWGLKVLPVGRMNEAGLDDEDVRLRDGIRAGVSAD